MRKTKVFLVGFLLSAGILTGCGKSSAKDLRNSGIQYMEQGNYEAAAAAFNQIFAEPGGKVGRLEKDALKYRAEAEYLMGDFSKAASSYEMLTKLYGKEDYFKYMKFVSEGQAYEEAEDYGNACVSYEAAIEIDSSRADVYNRLGLCKMKEGNYSEAIGIFQAGAELNDPEVTPLLLFNEAVSYEYMGEFQTALSKLEEYMEKYGTDEAVDRELAFLKTR